MNFDEYEFETVKINFKTIPIYLKFACEDS